LRCGSRPPHLLRSNGASPGEEAVFGAARRLPGAAVRPGPANRHWPALIDRISGIPPQCWRHTAFARRPRIRNAPFEWVGDPQCDDRQQFRRPLVREETEDAAWRPKARGKATETSRRSNKPAWPCVARVMSTRSATRRNRVFAVDSRCRANHVWMEGSLCAPLFRSNSGDATPRMGQASLDTGIIRCARARRPHDVFFAAATRLSM
jgi:hypothetical protein